ncbi:MAG TPA: TIGR03087 family PEP-CTERM/XrtA system glycosyltransferase [Acetobacteraceae bacterium]|jgi:sugar transferase (PEP-CTERM/EpsH1 system associated)|nr:TIGR03087 family PEP-CTERM/XrtA system glycosyltransferase [Acetobacteraceae bacterium]
MPDLLFLCHRIPYPPDKGDKIRAWPMLQHLARTHRVHLGCFVDDPADLVHVPVLRSVCADVMAVPLSPRLQKLRALARARPGRPLTLDYFRDARLAAWVDEVAARTRPARVFAFSSSMAPYALRVAGATRILDMVDLDSQKWVEQAQRARGPARLVWAREGRTLLAFEARAAAEFDRTLFCSEPEWARFAALAPDCRARTAWIENGVDLERFSPAHEFVRPFPDAGPRIVFTGAMDYWPNIDAVDWFARSVLPLVRARVPDAGFAIVGTNPAPAVQRLARLPGVAVTGRVADTRPYLAHAAVVIAPLRVARGIQNKVLEAMAMARPVVASPAAFEGVRATAGEALLVAEGEVAMAASVAAVLAGAHAGLGGAARAAVEAAYSWDATMRKLDAVWHVIDRRPGDTARKVA